jgi:hypothetical protein
MRTLSTSKESIGSCAAGSRFMRSPPKIMTTTDIHPRHYTSFDLTSDTEGVNAPLPSNSHPHPLFR